MKRFNLFLLILAMLTLTACAGGPGSRPPREPVTLGWLAAHPEATVNLQSAELVCSGERTSGTIDMQGRAVIADTCIQGELKGVTLSLGGDVFLHAVTRSDPSTGRYGTVAGFGALRRKGLLEPIDLNDAPRLPDWAGQGGP